MIWAYADKEKPDYIEKNTLWLCDTRVKFVTKGTYNLQHNDEYNLFTLKKFCVAYCLMKRVY